MAEPGQAHGTHISHNHTSYNCCVETPAHIKSRDLARLHILITRHNLKSTDNARPSALRWPIAIPRPYLA